MKLFSKLLSNLSWIILLGLIIYFTIRNNSNIDKLKSESVLTKAYLFEVKGVGSKGTIRGFYRFKVNNNYFEGFYDNDNLKKYDSIDILYYINDPKINQAQKFVLEY
jgi:hypothetical protein